MRVILRQEILAGAIGKVKSAAMKGFFDGRNVSEYFNSCKWYIEQYECQIIFTSELEKELSGEDKKNT